jgi:hypothetical protein
MTGGGYGRANLGVAAAGWDRLLRMQSRDRGPGMLPFYGVNTGSGPAN